jgi:hypothetical protein
MGYMRHHAIIVSDHGYGDHIEGALDKARQLGCAVSELVASPVNGLRSFLVAPDGSKEGWAESDLGDERRALFVEYLLAQSYEDGSSPLSWVEVQYGDDAWKTEIIRDSDDARRKGE